jgi:hypothetical protein
LKAEQVPNHNDIACLIITVSAQPRTYANTCCSSSVKASKWQLPLIALHRALLASVTVCSGNVKRIDDTQQPTSVWNLLAHPKGKVWQYPMHQHASAQPLLFAELVVAAACRPLEGTPRRKCIAGASHHGHGRAAAAGCHHQQAFCC